MTNKKQYKAVLNDTILELYLADNDALALAKAKELAGTNTGKLEVFVAVTRIHDRQPLTVWPLVHSLSYSGEDNKFKPTYFYLYTTREYPDEFCAKAKKDEAELEKKGFQVLWKNIVIGQCFVVYGCKVEI